MKNKHIAVLMGGWNSEREVSLSSGNAVYDSLIELGYKVDKIDFSRDIFQQLKDVNPDILFNALHGQYGEDGRIQGVCDILQIAYTHSGIVTSALCMDKVLTRQICSIAGVKSPSYELLKKGEDAQNIKKIATVGKPFVIKPISEGSSVGIEVILEDMDFDFSQYQWKYGDKIIIEKYLSGQEVQVAILGDKVLGAIEIRPSGLFYDYKCKYTSGMTNYVMPAEIPKDKYLEVLDLGKRCYEATGCRGVARIDFILNSKDGGDNEFYLLEVNTHPGLTPTSLVPKIAQHAGISFSHIVEFLIQEAQID